MIDYKFREGKLLEEVKRYIDGTYDAHYATGKIQATESIIDDGHGTGFCMGNVGKYGRRYGKKGETPAEWRKDLMKVMHYALIQLFIHDKLHSRESLYEGIASMSTLEEFADGVDLDHAPTLGRARLNDATPQEWDQATKSQMAFNPNGGTEKNRK